MNAKKSFFTVLSFIVNFLIYVGDLVRFAIWFSFDLIWLLVRGFVRIPGTIFKKLTASKISLFLLGMLVAITIIFIGQCYQFVAALPNPRLLQSASYPVSTKIFDRRGRVLYEIYGDEKRLPVPLNQLPSNLIKATIAIEDKDFHHHNGIAFSGGIIRALRDSVITGHIQGGSTITQQLVKTALLTPERTVTRKIKEAILALWVEHIYSKQQILNMYLNQVAYGGSSYGAEAASETYFGKKAIDLTLEEAAVLAGLPQAPSFYSPYNDPQRARARRNQVLETMWRQGDLSKVAFDQAVAKLIVVQPPKNVIHAPHFVFYVKSILEEKFGTRLVEEGGLQVYTSLDEDLEQTVEQMVSEEVGKIASLKVGNGAVLVTIPKTGEVLAMVGSKDFYEKPYGAYNVTTALRQPGSSIKPLMYSLALSRQYTPATIIDDSPVVYKVAGNKPFVPINYDSRFHGRVTLRTALANSYNVPAVKTLASLGVNDFISHAQKMGITTWNSPGRFGLSLTLGGGEVTMTDMAVSYGVFANGGVKQDLQPILKVTDYSGQTLLEKNSSNTRVLSEDVAFLISDILSDNAARSPAFGGHSALEIPGKKVAVKTGTTNSKRDNWTIGYTPRLLVAVWVGNNDNTPMNPALTSGVTGAAPIWNRVMTYALNFKNSLVTDKSIPETFMPPADIIKKPCLGRVEYFVNGTEKSVNCNYIPATPSATILPSP